MGHCADGTGAFIGFTVVIDWMCRDSSDSGNHVAATQALIRKHDDAITVDSIVKVKSIDEWENVLTSFESPNADDGCGSLDRMRKGCGRSNPTWSCAVEYNGEYAIEALIGAEGDLTRWNPDGSRREAYGWCNGATPFPSQVPKEESIGRLDWQWEGGKPNDRGFVKFYDPLGAEKFPTML